MLNPALMVAVGAAPRLHQRQQLTMPHAAAVEGAAAKKEEVDHISLVLDAIGEEPSNLGTLSMRAPARFPLRQSLC